MLISIRIKVENVTRLMRMIEAFLIKNMLFERESKAVHLREIRMLF